MFVVSVSSGGDIPELYGPFDTEEEAKEYVDNWVEHDEFSFAEDFDILPINFPAKWWT